MFCDKYLEYTEHIHLFENSQKHKCIYKDTKIQLLIDHIGDLFVPPRN